MGHTRHPDTREFIHHWFITNETVHLDEGDEGYYKGTCKVRRCKEVKYFPVNPATTYQSAWLKMKTEKAKEEKMKVK